MPRETCSAGALRSGLGNLGQIDEGPCYDIYSARYSRHCGMDQLNVTCQVHGKRISESTNSLSAAVFVSEYREVRFEEFIRLTDGQLDRQPLLSNQGSRIQAVFAEPPVHSRHAVGVRGSVDLYLYAPGEP